LWYLLIISVPTLIFSLGLAFMMMSLLRNQAITFLILLGMAALDIFWGWFRLGSLFDYMAFGLPVFKSGVIGFDNLSLIVNQRLLYFFLGLSLVFATVLLFRRLPQSKTHTVLSLVLMVIFFAGAMVCGVNTYTAYKTDIVDKQLVIETNKLYESAIFASLTKAGIDISHEGNRFTASADLVFTNDNREPLDSLLFSLNPSLEVTGVTSRGLPLNYRRRNHIITVEATEPLTTGQSDSIVISYSGSIDESFCYPDYINEMKQTPYRVVMLNVNKRQAFLSDKYVLLTPESHWYPVAALNYYPSNPARIKVDFTMFTLRVKSAEGMTAVSQGVGRQENGYHIFNPESPLTGLTLAIGDYRSDTLTVDSVKYISYYFPGDDYYKEELSELADTLPLLISGIMRELESGFSTRYPFSTLSFVEVPVQFYSYPRMSTQTRSEVQPSMVLLPEKLATLQNAGFRKQFVRQKKRMARTNQVVTDKELQVRLFNNFIRNTFISGENTRYVNGEVLNEPTRYRLGPSFYFFKNNFYSSDYPVINSVFEAHLQQISVPGPGRRGPFGGLSNNDRANMILKNSSLRDILAERPGSDTVAVIITLKGDQLFNLIRAEAGIDDFNSWFKKYIDDHRFRRVDIVTLDNDINERFGFEFHPFLDDWFNGKEQPGFLFSDIQAEETVVGDRMRYLVTFVVSNPEPVAGVFNISFRSGGPGDGGRGGRMAGAFQGGPGGEGSGISIQGRGMEAQNIERIVSMEPAQAKKISVIIDAQPRAILVNTLFAKNIPGEITIPLGEIRKLRRGAPATEDDEILPSLPLLNEPGELIVDNEDPGFDPGINQTDSPLKRLLGIKSTRGNDYQQGNQRYAPEFWQPVVLSSYYGRYILSAVTTRGGTGDKSAKWSVRIQEPGYYDIYCFIGKESGRTPGRIAGQRGTAGGGSPVEGGQGMPGSGQQPESPVKDLHYKVYHDDGIDEISVDFMTIDGGWNNLGRYYLSPDSATVELTNQSSGKVIMGDAIKWVKVNQEK
jgi:hypothetical protein